MSSKVKIIIAGVIIIVLLTGSLVALKLTEKPTDTSSSSSSQVESKLLYEKKADDIESVKINNQYGEYEVSRIGAEEWTVKDYEGLPLNQTVIQGVIDSVASVVSTKVIEENATDLEQYGLTKPVADVTVTFKDGNKTVKELLIGNPSPTAGQSYFAFKGEKTVYSVTTQNFASLSNPKISAISTILLDTPADDTKYPRIDDLTIERSDINYKIQLAYDESLVKKDESGTAANPTGATDNVHRMVEPVKMELNGGEKVTAVLRGMYGLTASNVVAIHPTPEQLADAGITAPAMVVTMKAEQDNYKLTIGKEVPTTVNSLGGRYGYFEGRDVLYQFNEQALPWLTLVPTDITSSMIVSTNIYELSKIEITTPDKSFTYDLTGADKDTFVAKKNGVTLNADKFRSFYQYILRTSGESLWLEDPATQVPDTKIVFTLKNGATQTLEFYNTTARQSIIKYNGKTMFKCRTSYVERLLQNITVLDDNGDIVQNW